MRYVQDDEPAKAVPGFPVHMDIDPPTTGPPAGQIETQIVRRSDRSNKGVPPDRLQVSFN